MEVFVDVTNNHHTEVTTVVYKVVRIGVAACNAIHDVGEVNSFQSGGRNVVVFIAERGVELTGADFEFRTDFPSCERVHHLDVLLAIAIGGTGNTVESFNLQTEVNTFAHLTIHNQTQALCLEWGRIVGAFFVCHEVPTCLQITGELHRHFLQKVAKVTLRFSSGFCHSFCYGLSGISFVSNCFFCHHSGCSEECTAKNSKNWFLHN